MKQNKINIKLIAIIIYFILSVSTLIYQKYTTAKVVEKADSAIQRQKEYSESIKTEESVIPQQSADINAVVVEDNGSQNVPSTDLFLKAVEAEKGEQQQQAQPQILDYGAQVAAYEAQAKAQQEKAAQQAAARQATAAQAYTAPMQQQVQPSAAANKMAASPVTAEKPQETKLNKLETRRIFK